MPVLLGLIVDLATSTSTQIGIDLIQCLLMYQQEKASIQHSNYTVSKEAIQQYTKYTSAC